MDGELWRLHECRSSRHRGCWVHKGVATPGSSSEAFYVIPNSVVVLIETIYNPKISYFTHYKILSNTGIGYVNELTWERRFEPLIAKENA